MAMPAYSQNVPTRQTPAPAPSRSTARRPVRRSYVEDDPSETWGPAQQQPLGSTGGISTAEQSTPLHLINKDLQEYGTFRDASQDGYFNTPTPGNSAGSPPATGQMSTPTSVTSPLTSISSNSTNITTPEAQSPLWPPPLKLASKDGENVSSAPRQRHSIAVVRRKPLPGSAARPDAPVRAATAASDSQGVETRAQTGAGAAFQQKVPVSLAVGSDQQGSQTGGEGAVTQGGSTTTAPSDLPGSEAEAQAVPGSTVRQEGPRGPAGPTQQAGETGAQAAGNGGEDNDADPSREPYILTPSDWERHRIIHEIAARQRAQAQAQANSSPDSQPPSPASPGPEAAFEGSRSPPPSYSYGMAGDPFAESTRRASNPNPMPDFDQTAFNNNPEYREYISARLSGQFYGSFAEYLYRTNYQPRAGETLPYFRTPIVYYGDGAGAANSANLMNQNLLNSRIKAHNRALRGPPPGEILTYPLRKTVEAVYNPAIAELGLSRDEFEKVVATVESIRMVTKGEVNKKGLAFTAGMGVLTLGTALPALALLGVHKRSEDANRRVSRYFAGINGDLKSRGIPIVWLCRPSVIIGAGYEIVLIHSPLE